MVSLFGFGLFYRKKMVNKLDMLGSYMLYSARVIGHVFSSLSM